MILLPIIGMLSAGLALALLILLPLGSVGELMAEQTVAPISAIIAWLSSVVLAVALTQRRPFRERVQAGLALLLAVGFAFTTTSIAQHRAVDVYEQFERSLLASSLWFTALDLTPAMIIGGYPAAAFIVTTVFLARWSAVALWHTLPSDETDDVLRRILIGLFGAPFWFQYPGGIFGLPDLTRWPSIDWLELLTWPIRTVMLAVMLVYVVMHSVELVRRIGLWLLGRPKLIAVGGVFGLFVITPIGIALAIIVGIGCPLALIIGVDYAERWFWFPLLRKIMSVPDDKKSTLLIALELSLGIAYYTHKVIAYTLWPHPEPAEPAPLLAES